MSLLLQYHSPIKNTPVFSPHCSVIFLPLTNLVGTSLLAFISWLWSFFFPHAILSHFTGQLGFGASAHDYIPVLCPTSSPPVMWVAVERQPQSQRSEWGSNQSHYHHCWCCRPQRGQRAHQLPHRSSQPRPEPRALGDSQPLCVISTLTLPRGYWRERGWGYCGREATERKRAPRGRGIFLWREQWSVRLRALLLLPPLLLLGVFYQHH